MPLTGNLKEFDLVSLLQILSGKFSTGRLIITKPFKKGILYLKEGKVINSEVGKLKGMPGFLELFTWEEGNFEFVDEDVSNVSVAISMSSEALILEAARIMDEWHEKGKIRIINLCALFSRSITCYSILSTSATFKKRS